MSLLDFQATMVLITGYDAKRRAAVIDRWLQLEQGWAQPAMGSRPKINQALLRERQVMAKEMDVALKLARKLGYKGNASLQMANEITRKGLGIGCLDYFGIGPIAPADGQPVEERGASRPALGRPPEPPSPIALFVEKWCLLANEYAVTESAELFATYQEFAKRAKIRPLSRSLFFRALYEHLPQLRRTRPSREDGTRFQAVCGIELREVGYEQ